MIQYLLETTKFEPSRPVIIGKRNGFYGKRAILSSKQLSFALLVCPFPFSRGQRVL